MNKNLPKHEFNLDFANRLLSRIENTIKTSKEALQQTNASKHLANMHCWNKTLPEARIKPTVACLELSNSWIGTVYDTYSAKYASVFKVVPHRKLSLKRLKNVR